MPIESNLVYKPSESLVKSAIGTKIVRGKKESIVGLVPKNQLAVSDHSIGYRTFQLDNPSSSAFSSAGNVLTFKLDKQSFGRCRHATIELKFSESGASNSVQLCPLPFMFQKIEIIANGGSGDILQTIYPEQWLLWLACLQRERLDAILQSANFNSNFWTNPESIPASGSKTYRCPLLCSWFDLIKPDFRSLNADIWVKFYTNTVVVSGSGTPSLQSFKIIFGTEEHNNHALMQYEQKINKMPRANRYLDVIRVEDSGTYTASTLRTISLENLVGKCLGLFVCLRSGSSYGSSSNSQLDFYDLGPNATLDLQDSSGQSLYGNGVAVPADYFRTEVFQHHFPSDLSVKQNVYILPFCDNFRNAIVAGEVSGYHQFNGDQTRLAIVPSGAGTAEIHTLNCNNAADDAGYYSLSSNGYVTDEIVYSTSAANMKAQIEALPHMLSEPGMTVTASASLTTDATITWSARANKLSGSPAARFGVTKVLSTSLNDGGVAEFVSSTVTTAGVRGWTTGTYTCSIYAFMARDSILDSGNVSFVNV